jgi:hypothetical protein
MAGLPAVGLLQAAQIVLSHCQQTLEPAQVGSPQTFSLQEGQEVKTSHREQEARSHPPQHCIVVSPQSSQKKCEHVPHATMFSSRQAEHAARSHPKQFKDSLQTTQ